MMSPIRNLLRSVVPVMIVILMLFGAGCKSKKKAMEADAAAAEKARMEQQAALQREKEAAEEEARRKEAEEKARREAEASTREPYQRLDLYFNAIANSNNATAANNSINETLALFASPQTPVLIVISESGGQKDYDRPTTIVDYLNYLKDQKKNSNKIGNLQFDSSGRITEVELIKQK
jgi:hypothetical protein